VIRKVIGERVGSRPRICISLFFALSEGFCLASEQLCQTDRANVDSSHLPLIASGEQHNRVLAVDDCWQLKIRVSWSLKGGFMRSAPSIVCFSFSCFDLKELPDLSYGCPSTQQQDELATTLWTYANLNGRPFVR